MLNFENPEGLIDFLKNNEEGKNIFQRILDNEYVKSSEIAGLVKNRDEIKDEKSRIKEKYLELEKKYNEIKEKTEEIDFEEYNRLKELEKSGLENSENSVEITNLQLKLNNKEKIFTKEKEKLEKELKQKDIFLNELENSLNNTLIENELNANLSRIGVDDQHKPLLFDAFKHKSFVEKSELNGRAVYISEGEGSSSIKDFFDAWVVGESAKLYIKAPVVTGGGSGGNAHFQGMDIKQLEQKITELAQKGYTEKAIRLQHQVTQLKQTGV